MAGKCRAVYAVYRGDEFVDLGTAEELRERTGMDARLIRWYCSPTWLRRSGGRGTVVIRIDDREDD